MYGIPRDVVAEVFTGNPAHRAFVMESLPKVQGNATSSGS
jgi:hypothetical protein